MLCVMHRSSDYGRLSRNGKPIDAAGLSGLIGGSQEEIKPLLDELEQEKVFSRDDAGVIFSRRMVRDHRIRETRKRTGSLGGNPALKKSAKKKKRGD